MSQNALKHRLQIGTDHQDADVAETLVFDIGLTGNITTPMQSPSIVDNDEDETGHATLQGVEADTPLQYGGTLPWTAKARNQVGVLAYMVGHGGVAASKQNVGSVTGVTQYWGGGHADVPRALTVGVVGDPASTDTRKNRVLMNCVGESFTINMSQFAPASVSGSIRYGGNIVDFGTGVTVNPPSTLTDISERLFAWPHLYLHTSPTIGYAKTPATATGGAWGAVAPTAASMLTNTLLAGSPTNIREQLTSLSLTMSQSFNLEHSYKSDGTLYVEHGDRWVTNTQQARLSLTFEAGSAVVMGLVDDHILGNQRGLEMYLCNSSLFDTAAYPFFGTSFGVMSPVPANPTGDSAGSNRDSKSTTLEYVAKYNVSEAVSWYQGFSFDGRTIGALGS